MSIHLNGIFMRAPSQTEYNSSRDFPLQAVYWAKAGPGLMQLSGRLCIWTRDGRTVFLDLRFSEGMPVLAKDFSQS
jgi:hypothetical protein